MSLIDEALKVIEHAYTKPIHELAARPALMLTGFVASALYLLEHANWAVEHQETSAAIDVEVFQRWMLESGLGEALNEVARIMQTGEGKKQMDKRIVFGHSDLEKPKL